MSIIPALVLATAGSAAAVDAPLLDGRCTEYAGASSHTVAEGVTLYIRQAAGHVWLCYTLPEDSYGAADLDIDAPGLTEALNLHVSAQLGEWPAAQPEAAPQDGNSDDWWNNEGWAANTVSFGGTNPDTGRPRFRPSAGREFQLSTARFGIGTYSLRLAIWSISTRPDDAETVYPPRPDPALTIEVQ